MGRPTKHTIESISEFALSKKLLLASTHYFDNETKMKFICMSCDKVSHRSLKSLLQCKHGCTDCIKRGFTVELSEVKRIFSSYGFTVVRYTTLTKNGLITVKCSKGHILEKSLVQIKHYPNCPACWEKSMKSDFKVIKKCQQRAKRPNLSEWKQEVKERDQFNCRCCCSQNNLVVHHLESYKDNPKLRAKEDNGVTLCVKCHREFHRIYGLKNFTRDNYYDFELRKTEEFFS